MADEIALHDEEAQKFLKNAIDRVGKIKESARPFVTALSSVVFQDIISHFEKEQGSKGPWQKWSKMYAEHMERIGKGGNRILQDTGHLRQSFQPTNWRSSREGILWFNPAKTKSGFPYAYAHDTGGKKLPQRDFMYLSDTAQERIEEVTLEFLEQGL